jgi:nitrite reductase (NO-forming)
MRLITLATALLLAAGCTAAPIADDLPDDTDVVVLAEDVYFEPERLEVPAGETIRVHLRNEGGIVHDLVFEEGWESGNVEPGGGVTVEIGPFTSPTVGWCSIPGHRDAGMELEIVVTDG